MSLENIYHLILRVYKQSVLLSILTPLTIILIVISLFTPLFVFFIFGIVLSTFWFLALSRTIKLFLEILHLIKKNA